MKKYFKLFPIALTLIFFLFLAACGSNSNGQQKEVCENHIDFNDDSLCDNCEEKIESICKNHTDENRDGICDNPSCSKKLDTEENNKNEESPKENGDDKEEPKKEEEENGGSPEAPSEPTKPCEVCVDLDENLICDVCKKTIIPSQEEPQGVTLVKEGKICFSVFLEHGSLSDAELSEIDELISYLEGIGISPKIYGNPYESDTDAKIIINSVSFLGKEYETDPHYLGPTGYAVKAEDDKILLRAGSAEALRCAIEYLKEKAFSKKPTESSVFLYSDSVEIIQTDYKFAEVLIGSADVNGYKITYAEADEEGLKLAKEIQSALYQNAGIWLPLIPDSELDDADCISVKTAARSGGVGFYSKITEGGSLEIISEFKNKTFETGNEYINSVFGVEGATAKFTETEINVRDIFYSDFGAAGDGKTDDFEAIKKAHDYANVFGHRVVADKGAKYYIGKTDSTITIRTDTYWNKATFIIDDRDIEYGDEARISIFTIASDFERISFDKEQIKAINDEDALTDKTERIDLSLGYTAILIIENESKKESVLIDADGYIAEGHALRSDFETVEEITVIRVDDSQITVEGGIFVTYSNQSRNPEPFARNIKVNRSNTVIRSITYEIEYEPEKDVGASPYLAFIEIDGAKGVSLSDITFSARTEYASGEESPIISAYFSHAITISRCDQDIDTFFAYDGISAACGFAGALSIYCSKEVTVTDSLINELYFDENTYLITLKNAISHKTESKSGDITVAASK